MPVGGLRGVAKVADAMIDPAELKRLAEQALADDERATPGPWTTYRCREGYIDANDACGVRSPANRDPDYGADVFQDASGDECHHIVGRADADLIAAARTREPQLARAALALAELWPKLESCDEARRVEYHGARPWDDLIAAFRRIRDGAS